MCRSHVKEEHADGDQRVYVQSAGVSVHSVGVTCLSRVSLWALMDRTQQAARSRLATPQLPAAQQQQAAVLRMQLPGRSRTGWCSMTGRGE